MTAMAAIVPTRPAAAEAPRSAPEILASMSTAVAIVGAASLEILYENDRFTEWFPAADRESTDLPARVPGHDRERTLARLGRNRAARWDAEVGEGVRRTSVEIELRPMTLGGTAVAILEARNIARQKEAEYMLDSYSRLVERQTRELQQEKERAEKLLLNIMPRRVYEELKDVGTTTPQSFDSVSVLMLDFEGFTEMSIAQDPTALVAELNDVFTSFDRIVEHFRGERIKTIGDAYMAVTGLPEPDPDHAIHMARIALRMLRYLERRNASSPTKWRARIGVGCGPVIGSIVGVQKYVYDIFGPAANMASRLEQLAEPNQILLCPEAAQRVRDEFTITSMGEHTLKGFGEVAIHALEGEARRGR